MLLFAACIPAHTQTRVLSYSRSTQAVVIEHEGELRVLKAADRKPQLDLIVERVDDAGAELRFTALPVADVIARVGRGADLVALRQRFSAPRNPPAETTRQSATLPGQAVTSVNPEVQSHTVAPAQTEPQRTPQ